MTKNNLKVVKTTKDKDLENKEKNKALFFSLFSKSLSFVVLTTFKLFFVI